MGRETLVIIIGETGYATAINIVHPLLHRVPDVSLGYLPGNRAFRPRAHSMFFPCKQLRPVLFIHDVDRTTGRAGRLFSTSSRKAVSLFPAWRLLANCIDF